MNIAIVGTGIAGLVAARGLHKHHDITLFEAEAHVGGHTHSHDIKLGGHDWVVDTGFIVHNDRTYPGFIHLLDELGVIAKPCPMSFSVRCERTGLEYNGASLNSLFAQRRNLLSPRFYRLIGEILRFYREAPGFLQAGDDHTLLLDYLKSRGYRQDFIDYYAIPMGAAIWSQAPGTIEAFPARHFIRFFHNHGMLSLTDWPQWRVIEGGSRNYVTALIAPFRDRIHLSTPVVRIDRDPQGITLYTATGAAARYEAVVLACHSDQALRLLANPVPEEREILGAIPYSENEVILHTDASVLPRNRRAWAGWNYYLPAQSQQHVLVTYNMNILQGLAAPETFCVSLNCKDTIDSSRVIERLTYHHPVYTPAGVAAQSRLSEISGKNRTYYAGAYWGYGFHEDGLQSGLRVIAGLDEG